MDLLIAMVKTILEFQLRYIDNPSNHLVTKLLNVIETGSSSTGEAIFDKIAVIQHKL